MFGGNLPHWWDSCFLIWIKRPLKFSEGAGNARCECTITYYCGCVLWLTVCSSWSLCYYENLLDFVCPMLVDWVVSHSPSLDWGHGFAFLCCQGSFLICSRRLEQKFFIIIIIIIRQWSHYHRHDYLNTLSFIYEEPPGCFDSQVSQPKTSAVPCGPSQNLMSAGVWTFPKM